MGEFQNEVIGVQGVEKFQEWGPSAFLDGLSTIVSKAKVDGFGAGEGVKEAIDGRCGQGAIGRIAGDVGFIHLETGAGKIGHLGCEGIGEGQRQRLKIPVMLIKQRPGQHVRAGDREFEVTTGDLGGAGAIFGEVEGALGDFIDDHASGFGTEFHFAPGAEGNGVATTHVGTDAAEAAQEIFNHAIGVGVVDIETIQLAIGGQIDSGLALGIKNDPGGVDDRLFTG
jgi:hypothetical protein